MELWEELLSHAIKNQKIKISLPRKFNANKLISNDCYNILKEIRGVLLDGANSDENCFEKIEKIIRSFEKRGIFCGNRHDF